MWLYVPNTSTSSPSALGEPASISASNWQFQALEQSVWWRGRPSQSRHWYQRWKKGSFIQLLYGAMPEPSMAALGVARWTASLVASRASHIALPAESAGSTTNEISGQMHAASSSSQERVLSSSKTSRACYRQGLTKSLERKEFEETFESLVLRLRSDCSRRQKLARLTKENASLSSQWPTATANMVTGAGSNGRDGGLNLQTAVAAFQVSAWPTPSARDWKGATDEKFGSNSRPLNEVEKIWDIAQPAEVEDEWVPSSLVELAQSAETAMWSTPRASDAEKGSPNQSFGAGGQPLPSQAVQWMTPRSHEVGLYQYSRGDKTKPVETLTGQAIAIYSPLARVTVKTGKPHSKERRSLNPLFVEWLMGWPPGWTLLAWTDFACSETELSLFKQRMRSALLSLGLPREAPPAQLALFG